MPAPDLRSAAASSSKKSAGKPPTATDGATDCELLIADDELEAALSAGVESAPSLSAPWSTNGKAELAAAPTEAGLDADDSFGDSSKKSAGRAAASKLGGGTVDFAALPVLDLSLFASLLLSDFEADKDAGTDVCCVSKKSAGNPAGAALEDAADTASA